MTQHIGIVACSPEGAALCYRTICAEGAQYLGRYAHPEVTMHTPSLAKYVDCLERGDLDGVAQLMLTSAHALAAAGADFLICPDNTIHQALPRVFPRSPLPWLHIADVVARLAKQRGYQRVGIVGTRWLMDSSVYPDAFASVGVGCARPAESQRAEIDHRIMDELVPGIFQPETTAYVLRVIEGLKQQGCDAVVLGCTEIPLVVNDANSPLPTLDSTRELARAALKRATLGELSARGSA